MVITKEVEENGSKYRKLVFSQVEKCTIINNEMLTDESIHIAQILLKDKFPNIWSFQDTVIGKVQEFDTLPFNVHRKQLWHE